MFLDHPGTPSVTVPLSKNGVDGAAEYLREFLEVLLLLLGLRVGIEVRDGESLALEFLDGGEELGDGGGDVGEFDDDAVGVLGLLSKVGECVVVLCELAEYPPCERDVSFFDVDAVGVCEFVEDGEEGVGGEHGGLVGVGVDDFSL